MADETPTELPTEITQMIFYIVVEDFIKQAKSTPFCEQGSSPEFKSCFSKIFQAVPKLFPEYPGLSKLKLYCYLHQRRCTSMFKLADSITATVFQAKNQTLHVEFSNKPAQSNAAYFDISLIKIDDFPILIHDFVKTKHNICTLTLKADFDLALPNSGTFIGDVWQWNRPIGIMRSKH